tara:strand:+ start:592 stop:861 length:270 start_codon:yes stop_codon:yes gene_type:complete
MAEQEKKMDRTDEQKATDYTNMGHSVTVINNLITGDSSVIGDMTEAQRKEKVKRNYASLEVVKAYDDWGDEDMTAVDKAITDADTFTGE